jgi:hypothetical protein
MATADIHTTIEKLLEAVFFMQPVPRLYNEGQLPLEESLKMAMRSIRGWCEIGASLGVSQLEQ